MLEYLASLISWFIIGSSPPPVRTTKSIQRGYAASRKIEGMKE